MPSEDALPKFRTHCVSRRPQRGGGGASRMAVAIKGRIGQRKPGRVHGDSCLFGVPRVVSRTVRGGSTQALRGVTCELSKIRLSGRQGIPKAGGAVLGHRPAAVTTPVERGVVI